MAGGMSTLLVTSTAAKPNPPDRSVVALAPSPVSARPSTPAHYIETTCRKVRSTGHASPPWRCQPASAISAASAPAVGLSHRRRPYDRG